MQYKYCISDWFFSESRRRKKAPVKGSLVDGSMAWLRLLVAAVFRGRSCRRSKIHAKSETSMGMLCWVSAGDGPSDSGGGSGEAGYSWARECSTWWCAEGSPARTLTAGSTENLGKHLRYLEVGRPSLKAVLSVHYKDGWRTATYYHNLNQQSDQQPFTQQQ